MALGRTTSARALGLLLAVAALGLALALSISVGAKSIALDRVWGLLLHPDGSEDAVVVRDLRLPRTMLGLSVGAALGVAGAVMQALTRNPLADPGVLGINAGAATAIVLGVAVLGVSAPAAYVWLGFGGAAAAALLVYGIGAQGRSGATPVRLALAGTAVTAALTAVVNGVTVMDPETLQHYRFWLVGALGGHERETLGQIAPFLGAGLVAALALARPLNALALGEDAGRALGAHVGRTRAAGALAVTLLCGAATAAAGPIIFVGLTVPHLARALCGPDQRWVLPSCAVLAPTLLLAADVLGRIVDRPGEIQVGIVAAIVGGPVFVALIRRQRIAQL
jgi:iron complex transport system permease protein